MVDFRNRQNQTTAPAAQSPGAPRPPSRAAAAVLVPPLVSLLFVWAKSPNGGVTEEARCLHGWRASPARAWRCPPHLGRMLTSQPSKTCLPCRFPGAARRKLIPDVPCRAMPSICDGHLYSVRLRRPPQPLAFAVQARRPATLTGGGPLCAASGPDRATGRPGRMACRLLHHTPEVPSESAGNRITLPSSGPPNRMTQHAAYAAVLDSSVSWTPACPPGCAARQTTRAPVARAGPGLRSYMDSSAWRSNSSSEIACGARE